MNFNNRQLDFVQHKKKFFILSIVLISCGLLVLVFKGLNLGIDFESGSRVQITADHQVSEQEISDELTELGFEPNAIRLLGDDLNIAAARYINVLNKEEIAKIKDYYIEKYGEEPSISTVSPTVGRDLARNAMFAVGIAAIGIIIYVAIRFEFLMGVTAVIALLHDAFFIVAVFSLLQLEVDLTFIAAVLTIVGYSINDTIVTFDRIRENMKYAKIKNYKDLAKVVNDSLVQTLTRSINTVITVVFASVALLIFGSEAIRNFAFALTVGLVAGTYSSLFIAAQLWLVWKNKQLEKRKFRSVPSESK